MKKLFTALLIIISVCLGAFRFIDIAYMTDEGGFSTVLSSGVRYAILVVAVVLIVLYGKVFIEKNIVATGNRLIYLFTAIAGTIHVVCGIIYLIIAVSSISLVTEIVMASLMLFCGVWLSVTGFLSLSKNEPVGGMVIFPIISASFYYALLIMRFIDDPASYHRISLTLDALIPLTVLLFFSSYIRQLYFRVRVHKKMLTSGLVCFLFAGCILPAEMFFKTNSTVTDVTMLLQNICLFSIGILGLVIPLCINRHTDNSSKPIY